MRKLVAVACAAVLFAAALAGCSGKEYTVKQEDIGKIIAYDAPAGYELYGSNDQSAVFVKYGPGGAEEEDYSHVIEIAYDYTDESWNKGIGSGKQDVLEDELLVDFEDNLTLKFVKMNGHPGVRIEDKQDGQVEEITYYLLIGEWRVRLMVLGYPENIEETDKDLESFVDSIRLEHLVFE